MPARWRTDGGRVLQKMCLGLWTLRPKALGHSFAWPSQTKTFRACQAADCARVLQKWEQVKDLYQRAAECYGEAGRGQAAAEALSKGARALEDQNPKVHFRGWATTP